MTIGKPHKANFVKILFILVGIISIFIIYAYWEARSIKLTEVEFESDEIPEGFIGKKIIFISDIHCNQYFDKQDVVELIKRINDRNPDFIILGGDNIHTKQKYVEPFLNGIKELKAKYGVYSVLGNHDYWGFATQLQKEFTDYGFHICDNKSYWVKEGNDSIKIGGVGDMWGDEQILENTIEDVKLDNFCILLSHNPFYIDEIETNRIDLMLSGHTHGGQITFFGIYPLAMPGENSVNYLPADPKYRYGWFEKDGIKLYVTSGIGTSIPFRFFARPEIVEITLRNKK